LKRFLPSFIHSSFFLRAGNKGNKDEGELGWRVSIADHSADSVPSIHPAIDIDANDGRQNAHSFAGAHAAMANSR
jgi:hypothetical protein